MKTIEYVQGGEVISVPDHRPDIGGKKFDQGKPALDLIPAEFLLEVGKVLNFGAMKYDRANWAQGIEYSRLISAALRHIYAFNSGEDKDPESGISHIGHAGCNLAFLSWHLANRTDLDNRWVKLIKPRS